MEHLIGSQESHSTLRLALAAKAAGIPVIAWKREHKRAITKDQVHGQPYKLDPIYIMIP
jgi:hypothetical protein